MTSQRFDKSRLPSRHVTEGPARAPHRSYFYAMGITEEEIHQPWVGVATCWNEAAPCNIALNRQARSRPVRLRLGRVVHQYLGVSGLSGQFGHDRGKHAYPAPPLTTAIERLRRTIGGRRARVDP
jgi:hypothetical protein